MPSLARHHHVVVTDAAIRAAIELTDIWVTDRRRPDKAIDALDEACAHTQATAVYSPRLESLIAQRRAWGRRAANTGANGARGAADAQFDRIARDGFAVLERLGAELEAAFVRPQPVESWGEGNPHAAPAPAPPSAPAEPSGAERAALDIEIERQLLDEGIVVRGHDVARVVGLMIGRRVDWEE
jgi:ATP-dependent Clp protease ATP-binding subunit ClpA